VRPSPRLAAHSRVASVGAGARASGGHALREGVAILPARGIAATKARKVLSWPRRYKLTHACRWEYNYKRLKLAQLLGQLGIFLIQSEFEDARGGSEGLCAPFVGERIWKFEIRLVRRGGTGCAGLRLRPKTAPGHSRPWLPGAATTRGAASEKGVRLAQIMPVGLCIPVGIQLYKAEIGPTSGPTRRLPHLGAATDGRVPEVAA
jgi:hypothetical protein